MHAEMVLQKLHVARFKHPVHRNIWPAGGSIKFGKGSMLLVCQLWSGREVALADLVIRAHIEGCHFALHIQESQ